MRFLLQIPDKKQLLDHIQTKMKELGIDQTDLGNETGLGQSRLNKILHEKQGLDYYEAEIILNTLEEISSKKSEVIPLDLKKTVCDILTPKGEVVSASRGDKLTYVAKTMFDKSFSQLPIKTQPHESNTKRFAITELSVLGLMWEKGIEATREMTVDDVHKRYLEPTPVVLENSSLRSLLFHINNNYFAMVKDANGHDTGFVTRADLLKVLYEL